MARKKNGPDNRIRIMEALSVCLQEKPYNKTTIKEIAATAGVNHGLLHYYFKSKDDILAHYIDHIIFHYRSVFEQWLSEKEKAGIEERRLIESFFDFMNDRITLNRPLSMAFIEIWEIGMYNREIRQKIQVAYAEWIRVLSGMLNRVMKDKDAANRAGISIMAFLEGMALFSILLEPETLDLEGVLTDFRHRMIDRL